MSLLPRVAVCGAFLVGIPPSAFAQEATTFQYDVHGRLTAITRSSGGSGSTSTYTYDPADNRTNRTIVLTSSRSSRMTGEQSEASETDPRVLAPEFVTPPTNRSAESPSIRSPAPQGGDQ